MKKTPSTNADHSNSSAVKQTTVKGFKSILAFITKFNNNLVLTSHQASHLTSW